MSNVDETKIPSGFTEAEDIGWILCGDWGTGGTLEFANEGVFNRPLNRLFGNTAWLKTEVEEIQDDFLNHNTSESAHWVSIDAWMSDEDTILPTIKIKKYLTSPYVGIEDAQVADGAAISESKLDLTLTAVPRLTSSEETKEDNYVDTADIAQDVQAIFASVGYGSFSFLDYISSAFKAVGFSGWVENFPTIFHSSGDGHIITSGNFLHLKKENQTSSNLMLNGIPVVFGNTGGLGDEFLLAICNQELVGKFSGALSNIYTATSLEDSGRSDMLFLELWAEDISKINTVAPYGNIYSGIDLSSETFEIDYESTELFRYPSSGIVELTTEAYQEAKNLTFKGPNYCNSQMRWRVRILENCDKYGLLKAAPQGILPSPINNNDPITLSSTLSSANITVSNVEDYPKLITGTRLEILDSGHINAETAYVRRVSESTIWLAETLQKALSGLESHCYYGESTGTFTVRLWEEFESTSLEVSNESLSETNDLGYLLFEGDGFSTGDGVVITVYDPETVGHNFSFDDDSLEGDFELLRVGENRFRINGFVESGTFLKRIEGVGESSDPVSGRLVIEYLGKTNTLDISKFTFFGVSSEGNTFERVGSMPNEIIIDVPDWYGRDSILCHMEIVDSYYVHSNLGELNTGDILYVNNPLNEYGESDGTFTLHPTYRDAIDNLNGLRATIHIGMGITEEIDNFLTISLTNLFSKSEEDPYSYNATLIVESGTEIPVYAYPIFKIGRRNAGIYDPTYNPNGTAYGRTSVSSVSDCFLESKIVCCEEGKYVLDMENTIYNLKANINYDKNLSTNDYFTVSGVKYYRTGFCYASNEDILGVTARPDNCFYNSISVYDIEDCRFNVSGCGLDMNNVLKQNMDFAFRGAVSGAMDEIPMSLGNSSGVFRPYVINRDTLSSISKTDPSFLESFGNLVNNKKIVDNSSEEDAMWLSNELLDGLRRIWSDTESEQCDTQRITVPACSAGVNLFSETETNVNYQGYKKYYDLDPLISPPPLDIDIISRKIPYLIKSGEVWSLGTKYGMSGIKIYKDDLISGYYDDGVNPDKRRVYFSYDENTSRVFKVFEDPNLEVSMDVDRVDIVSLVSNISIQDSIGNLISEDPDSYIPVDSDDSDYISFEAYASGEKIYLSSDDGEILKGSVLFKVIKDGKIFLFNLNVTECYEDGVFSIPNYGYMTLLSIRFPKPDDTAYYRINSFRCPRELDPDNVYRLVFYRDGETLKGVISPEIGEESEVVSLTVDEYVDATAIMSFLPAPVLDSDVISSEDLSLFTKVNEANKTIELDKAWITGTPVVFSYNSWINGAGDLDVPNYLIRICDDLNFYFLTDNNLGAIAYTRRESVPSWDGSSFKMNVLATRERIDTTNVDSLRTRDASDEFKNTLNSQEEWITGTPVYIYTEGSLKSVQYLSGEEYDEVSFDIPIGESLEYILVNMATGNYCEGMFEDGFEFGQYFSLSLSGNDIPESLVSDKIYYASLIRDKEEDGNRVCRMYLSDSFLSSMMNRRVDIEGISDSGKLALSPCAIPSTEKVLLGSGDTDALENTFLVSGDWVTGMPIQISPVGNSIMPSGISSDQVYYVEKTSNNKIKLISDFKSYYEYKTGSLPESSLGENIENSEDYENYVSEDLPTITSIIKDEIAIFGGYTFTSTSGVSISGTNLGDDGDEVTLRFGNKTAVGIVSGSGTVIGDITIPSYAYDGLVEVTALCGDRWSNPLYYMYLSSVGGDTRRFYLFSSEKSSFLLGDSHEEYEEYEWESSELSVYCYYRLDDGVIEDVVSNYKVRAERYSTENTSIIDDELIVDFDITSVERIKTVLGMDSPVLKIKFQYTHPNIQPISGLPQFIQAISDLFIINLDEEIVSRNSIPVSDFEIIGETEVGFYRIDSISFPKGGTPDLGFSYGNNEYESRVRLAVPGYTSSTAVLSIKDANDQWEEIVTGYRTREYFSGDNKDPEDVIYVTLPNKIAVGNAKISFVGNEDISADIPFINLNSPNVFEDQEEEFTGTEETVSDFYGSGIDSINFVYLSVSVKSYTPELYPIGEKYTLDVEILDKASTQISVKIPKLISMKTDSSEDLSSNYDIHINFVSVDGGVCSIPITFTGISQFVNPSIYALSTNVIPVEDNEVGIISNSNETFIRAFGNNLSIIENIYIQESGGSLFDTESPMEIVYRGYNSIVFKLPRISLSDNLSSGEEHEYGLLYSSNMFSSAIIEIDTTEKIKFISNDNFSILPYITQISPEVIPGYEDSRVEIYGKNLKDVYSVQVGSQFFDRIHVDIFPGVSGGEDRLVVSLNSSNDKDILPVQVKILYGDSSYLSSEVVYAKSITNPFVDIEDDGVGTIEIEGKSWVKESHNSSDWDDSLKTIKFSQNLPTGCPIYFSHDGGEKSWYAVNRNLQKVIITLDEETVFPSTGSFWMIDTRQYTDNNGDLVPNSNLGIARYSEIISVSTGGKATISSDFWNSGKKVVLIENSGSFPTEESIIYQITEDNIYYLVQEDVENRYFISLVSSIFDSVSDSPDFEDVPFELETLDFYPLGSKTAYGIFNHVIQNEEGGEETPSRRAYIDTVSNAFVQFGLPENLRWMSGTPVRIGSSLPTTLSENKVYFNASTDSNLLELSESSDDNTLIDISGGYGFLEVTRTYPDIKSDHVFYVKNVGDGIGIKLYDSISSFLEDSSIELIRSNSAVIHIVPTCSVKYFSNSDVDQTLGMIYVNSEDNVSGTPVQFISNNADDNTSTTYFILQTPLTSESKKAISIFRSANDALRVEDAICTIYAREVNTGCVMNTLFTGMIMNQSLLTGGSESHIDMGLLNSLFKDQSFATEEEKEEFCEKISGVPVRITLNKVITNTELGGDLIDVTYILKYEENAGLSTRPHNTFRDLRLPDPKNCVGGLEDKYLIKDGRYSNSVSMGSTPYWKTFDFDRYWDTLTTQNEANRDFYEAHYNSMKYSDFEIPFNFNGSSLDTSDFSVSEDIPNSLYGYTSGKSVTVNLNDFIPDYVKTKSIYVDRVIFKLYESGDIYGIASIDGSGKISQPPGGVKVTWNCVQNTVIFSQLPDEFTLSFVLGLSVVESDLTTILSEYGNCEGNVVESYPQSKEIYFVGVKRILFGSRFGWETFTMPSEYDWDFEGSAQESQEFKNVLSYSGTCWKREKVGEEYTSSRELVFLGMDESSGPQITLSRCPSNLIMPTEEELEFLYVADSRYAVLDDNTMIIPPEAEDVEIFCVGGGNPLNDISLDNYEIATSLNSLIKTYSGSGSKRDVSKTYSYPFLLFDFNKLNDLSQYSIIPLESVEFDTSFIISKDFWVENNLDSYNSGDIYLDMFTPLYNSMINLDGATIEANYSVPDFNPKAEVFSNLIKIDNVIYLSVGVKEGIHIENNVFKVFGNWIAK